jgi:hypothetical protein
MFLSTARLSLIGLFLTLPLSLACGSSQPSANPATTAEIKQNDLPFSTKEPEIYRADVSISGGDLEARYFVAKSGSKRRLDTYVDDKVAVTELLTDVRYVIDHRRKLYYAEASTDSGPAAIDPASLAYFQNTQHYQFEQTGRSNGQTTYRGKVQDGEPDEVALITIDDASGLMVREEANGTEPGEKFMFELANVRLEAPDDLFQIPAGYKQVSSAEFKSTQLSKNHE